MTSIIWFGFAVPSKTPQAIVEHMSSDLARASAEPAQKQVLDKTGWEMMLFGPGPFKELIQRERALLAKVVAEIGIKPE